MKKLRRAATYSIVGFSVEVVFSAIHDAMRDRPVRFRTSAWMLPIYALIQPLYEPLHESLRERPVALRASTYAAGFFGVEFLSGSLLRKLLGEAPWDYAEARWNVDGLIRPDYALLWAAAGIALERLHDHLAEGDGPA